MRLDACRLCGARTKNNKVIWYADNGTPKSMTLCPTHCATSYRYTLSASTKKELLAHMATAALLGTDY